MRQIYLCLSLSLMFSTVFGQKLTDKFNYKATYQLTWQIDSTDAESVQSEKMVLFIGDGISRFSSEGRHISDSIRDVYKDRERTSDNLRERNAKTPGTKFKYLINKNLISSQVKFEDRVVKDNYRYSEDLSAMKWQILPKTEKVAGFSAQKAKTSFAGRKYTAWFTSEIPIPDGPYKFIGLPGLIVKIADEEKYYVFELTGFKSLREPIFNTETDKSYLEVSKPELNQIKKKYNANPITALERAGITFGFKPGERQRMKKEHLEEVKKENNPIELE